jgi:hypothetical protein
MAGNSADLREQADVLDTWANAMATSYASKSKRPQEEMLALLMDGKDHWYTAAEAQAMGFVDTVVAALPLAASGSAPADLSRFRDVPAALLAARAPSTPAAPHQAQQATSAAAAAITLENPPMTSSVTLAAAALTQNPATPDAAAIAAQTLAAD